MTDRGTVQRSILSVTGEIATMTTVTIPLSEEKQARLQSLAERAGMTSEEFLRRRVEKLLEEPDDAFTEAVGYVLGKNAELYRRLA
jgi:antitoxin FitA